MNTDELINEFLIIGLCKICLFIGRGVPLPSPYEIHNTYVADAQAYVDSQIPIWQEYGCTIMSDGWTGPTRLSITDVMVYAAGKTVFSKFIDASDKIKNWQYIYKILSEVVKEIGQHNVIQVVTYNRSSYKMADKKLADKFNLYWTPCAAHCMDLMLEDVGKRETISRVVKDAREITKFIYNHGIVLSKMREQGEGEIVRPGPTRFATNYLALTSLKSNKGGLRKMFTSDWWETTTFRNTSIGRFVESKVLDQTFWLHLDGVCKVFEPMYTTLLFLDIEVVPTLGTCLNLLCDELSTL